MGTGLKEIHQKLYKHKSNVLKANAARDLAEFYADSRNITDIWNGGQTEEITFEGSVKTRGLSDIEKEFITPYIQYGGVEFAPTTKAIAEKHGIEPPKPKYSWHDGDFYDTGSYYSEYLLFLRLIHQKYSESKAVILFPGGKEMPPFVMSALKEIIPPMTFDYPGFTPSPKDYIICREDRISDFAAVTRFAASERLKVKQFTIDITKAKLAKMAEAIGFDEVCDSGGKFSTPKEVKNINDFRVAVSLFALSEACGLIEINKDLTVAPGKKSVELLSKPSHEFAKILFDSYRGENKIYETRYVTYISVYDGDSCIRWSDARAPIIELLKTCPVNSWVNFEDFNRYALITRGNFFRNLLNCPVVIKGYRYEDDDFGYYYGSSAPDWDECEARIIARMLSFMGAIGMLDIVYTENVPRIQYNSGDFEVGISGFRITGLGAWLLNLTKEYTPLKIAGYQETGGSLLVQPDHTVIITGLKRRIKYGTYLSKFLTKVSDDANAVIYRIDFQAMVRAFDQKIQPEKIKEYLKKASDKPIPENVIRSLDDWQAKAGRVKIRTVTIIETDSELLLAELKAIKNMSKYTGNDIVHAVEIDENEVKTVKKLAEKNGWLVKL
jgi:hypothetical protein